MSQSGHGVCRCKPGLAPVRLPALRNDLPALLRPGQLSLLCRIHSKPNPFHRVTPPRDGAASAWMRWMRAFQRPDRLAAALRWLRRPSDKQIMLSTASHSPWLEESRAAGAPFGTGVSGHPIVRGIVWDMGESRSDSLAIVMEASACSRPAAPIGRHAHPLAADGTLTAPVFDFAEMRRRIGLAPVRALSAHFRLDEPQVAPRLPANAHTHTAATPIAGRAHPGDDCCVGPGAPVGGARGDSGDGAGGAGQAASDGGRAGAGEGVAGSSVSSELGVPVWPHQRCYMPRPLQCADLDRRGIPRAVVTQNAQENLDYFHRHHFPLP